MKHHLSKSFLLIFSLLFVTFFGTAQTNFTLKIVDSETNDPLPFANVYLSNNAYGSATNLDGEASILLSKGFVATDTLQCSYIGYEDAAVVINLKKETTITVRLIPKQTVLKEIAVTAKTSDLSAKKILKTVWRNLKKNYAQSPVILKGFYRETVEENNQYCQLNEAFFEIFYTKYPQRGNSKKSWNAYYETYAQADYYPSENTVLFVNGQFIKYFNTADDQCKITAARASDNFTKDEIEPVALNGPLNITALDKVKYQSDFLDSKLFRKYTFSKRGATYIDGELCYIIAFQPEKIKITQSKDFSKKMKEPIFSGTLYISVGDFAVVKFECQIAQETIPPTRYRHLIPTYNSLTCDYQKIGNQWFLHKMETTQILTQATWSGIKLPKELTRQLTVQTVEQNNPQPFYFAIETTMKDKRRGNLRYFSTNYDSIFWKNPTNYPSLSDKIVKDLSKTKPLERQFKERFYKAKLSYPNYHEKLDTLCIGKEISVDEYQWLAMEKDSLVQANWKLENRYFNNYFKPQKADYAKAIQNIFSRTRRCPTKEKKKENAVKLKRGFSDTGEYGFVLVRNGENQLLVNFDKEICKTCTPFAQAINKDFSTIAFLTVDNSKKRNKTLMIKNLAQDSIVAQLENVSEFAWMNNKTLFYLTQDELHRNNKIGSYSLDLQKDNLLLDIPNISENAEFLDFSKDRKQAYFLIEKGSFTDVILIDSILQTQSLFAKSAKKYVNGMEEDAYFLYFLVKNADNESQIIRKSKTDFSREAPWEIFLKAKNKELIDDFKLTENYVLVQTLNEGFVQLFSYEKTDLSKRRELKFPEKHRDITIFKTENFSQDSVAIGYSSLNELSGSYLLNLANEEREFTPNLCHGRQREKNLPVYTTKMMQVPIAGTSDFVPLRISKKQGEAATIQGVLLKVSGAYGAFTPKGYDEFETFWMDKGYAVASADVRGTRTLGWDWYEAGKKQNKINGINDYLACVRYLKQQYPTAKIIGYGQSAGGVILGAAVNQAPELFHSAVFDYAYLDVLTTMANENLPLTALEYDEWGNPNSSTDYQAINAYSPYQNISKQAYPNMIFFAGQYDFQTPTWQILKTAVKYREMNTSDTEMLVHIGKNGHAGSFPIGQRAKEFIYMHLFVEDL